MVKVFEKSTDENYGYRFEIVDNLLFIINKCSKQQFILDTNEVAFLERALEELRKQEDKTPTKKVQGK